MGKNLPANAGDADSIPGLGRSPGERNGNPTPVVLSGKSHGQRSLVGYSPWGHKELDMTELLSIHAEKTKYATPLFKTCQFFGESKFCLHLI